MSMIETQNDTRIQSITLEDVFNTKNTNHNFIHTRIYLPRTYSTLDGYPHFCEVMRGPLKQHNPHATPHQLTSALMYLWHSLSEYEKKLY